MPPRAATVRFYFDADILGLAHVIASLRTDCTYPGDQGITLNKRKRPQCIIQDKGTLDPVWVPKVTDKGWIIVTRDHNIRENPAERRIVRESEARMVALSGDDAGNKWAQLELLMIRWREIEKLVNEPGPFIFLASRSRMRRLPLEDTPAPRPRVTRRPELGRRGQRRPEEPSNRLW